MKKLLSILLASLLLLSLAACSSGGKKETRTIETEDFGITYRMTFDATDDIVTKITQTTTVDPDLLSDEVVAILLESCEAMKEEYDAIAGVEYSYEGSTESFVETIVIDCTNSKTLQTLNDLGYLPIEGDAKALSLSASIEGMVDSGWVEVK